MKLEIDRKSLLVHADADMTLGAVERALDIAGLTLGITSANPEQTVRAFIEGGAIGSKSPWLDPADHLIAGLSAVEANPKSSRTPRKLEVHPAPRRAVGPDLTSLVVGQRGKFFDLRAAWLRVHPKIKETNGVVTEPAPFAAPPEEALNEGEIKLFAAIGTELSR